MAAFRRLGYVFHPMKENPVPMKTRSGFTLVEMLVVVVIIASLAAVALGVIPKMRKKGDSAKSVQNLRQISVLAATYAADHSMALPAPEPEVPDGNGGTVTGVMWHQALASEAYPDTALSKIRWDHKWWTTNKPLLLNPLMPQKDVRAWFPGFAINMQINISNTGWGTGWTDGPKTRDMRLASISDPARTPFVVPDKNWFFHKGKLSEAGMKPFLVDGKLPVLFVDGHVENMVPKEYFSRKLDDMPLKP